MKMENWGVFFHSVLAQSAAGYSKGVILNVDCAGLLVQLSQARDSFYKYTHGEGGLDFQIRCILSLAYLFGAL